MLSSLLETMVSKDVSLIFFFFFLLRIFLWLFMTTLQSIKSFRIPSFFFLIVYIITKLDYIEICSFSFFSFVFETRSYYVTLLGLELTSQPVPHRVLPAPAFRVLRSVAVSPQLVSMYIKVILRKRFLEFQVFLVLYISLTPLL
jgi:hypothetical protein